MQPVIRGRKMILNYTDGSPCPSLDRRRDYSSREIIGDDDDDKDDDEDEGDSKPPTSSTRRKTTIISMLCERDPLMPLLTLSFIASPDECTYVFEARTNTACHVIEQAKQTLSPSGVFGVILIIAIMVYIVGGCVYSRMVLNQRGWRQLPNYSLWAGICTFFKVCELLLEMRAIIHNLAYANFVCSGHLRHPHILMYETDPIKNAAIVTQMVVSAVLAVVGRVETTMQRTG